MKDDIYVLACERDTYNPDPDSRPIVFEQYIDGDYASLDSVKRFKERLGDKYGHVRIAKLVFTDE
jgi:hypothetical protein